MPTTVAGNEMSGLLQGMGIGMTQTVLAARYMYFTPNNSDPDMPGIIVIVQGLQRGLNKAFPAAKLAVDGQLGPRTGTLLRQVVPAEFAVLGTVPWFKLYGFVYAAMNERSNPDELSRPRTVLVPTPAAGGQPQVALSPGTPGGLVPLSAGATDPFLIAGGVLLTWLFFFQKPTRARRRR